MVTSSNGQVSYSEYTAGTLEQIKIKISSEIEIEAHLLLLVHLFFISRVLVIKGKRLLGFLNGNVNLIEAWLKLKQYLMGLILIMGTERNLSDEWLNEFFNLLAFFNWIKNNPSVPALYCGDNFIEGW